MFDKLKQLAQMKGLQDAIKNERIEHERQGIKVVVRGDFSVEEIVLNPDLTKEQQEKILAECLNEANHKAKMMAAQKFAGLM